MTTSDQRPRTAAATGTVPTPGDAAVVGRLQQEWILRWDRRPGDAPTAFRATFDDLYEWDGADVLLQDQYDPQKRTFDSAAAYGDAFWPGFQQLRSAEHAFAEAPRTLVAGDVAASRFVFVARLVTADGTVEINSCTTSQVWRRDAAGRWRIVRDQTMIEGLGHEAGEQAMASLPRRPVA